MKILLVLLMSVGVAWSLDRQPQTPKKEELTIYLTPLESKVIQIEASADADIIDSNLSNGPDKQIPISTPNKPTTTTSTTSAPVTEKNVPLDLSQRLFFANHEDSQHSRKTLDLSDLDLSGEDVLKILHGLNSSTLDSIARLDLSHNRLWGLPPRVWPHNLEYSLRELRLDHNPLSNDALENRRVTRFELQRLLSLKKLSLSHCDLSSSGSSLILEHTPVESLDLSNNRLIVLPDSLANLPTLRHLDLSGNSIRYLSGSPLSSLTGLWSLNLSHNGIEEMFDDPIEKLDVLETLHLEHNNLSEPPKLYKLEGSYQPQLEVYMRGNTFRCGCSFRNVLDNVRVKVVDKSNVTCEDDKGVASTLEGSHCSPHWEAVQEKWSGVKGWVQHNRPDWSTLYRSLGWVLFGVTLGLVYAHRRIKKTPPPSQVPYNILDDRAVC